MFSLLYKNKAHSEIDHINKDTSIGIPTTVDRLIKISIVVSETEYTDISF